MLWPRETTVLRRATWLQRWEKWRGALLIAVCGLALQRQAKAIIYRDDETDATSLALAQQPQFNGAGQVGVQDPPGTTQYGPNGSGVAIASDWVLTAKHLFVGAMAGSSPAFYLGGVEYTGTLYTDPNSDLALIQLSTNLPASVNIIQANIPADNISPLNQVIWTVGYGGATNYSNQNGNLSYNTGVRAGTNVIQISTATPSGARTTKIPLPTLPTTKPALPRVTAAAQCISNPATGGTSPA